MKEAIQLSFEPLQIEKKPSKPVGHDLLIEVARGQLSFNSNIRSLWIAVITTSMISLLQGVILIMLLLR